MVELATKTDDGEFSSLADSPDIKFNSLRDARCAIRKLRKQRQVAIVLSSVFLARRNRYRLAELTVHKRPLSDSGSLHLHQGQRGRAPHIGYETGTCCQTLARSSPDLTYCDRVRRGCNVDAIRFENNERGLGVPEKAMHRQRRHECPGTVGTTSPPATIDNARNAVAQTQLGPRTSCFHVSADVSPRIRSAFHRQTHPRRTSDCRIAHPWSLLVLGVKGLSNGISSGLHRGGSVRNDARLR